MDSHALAIERLLQDPDFKEVDTRLKRQNLFQVLSLADDELAHSRALRWLLDPNEGHGLGAMVLRGLLRLAALRVRERGITYPTGHGEPIRPLMCELLALSDASVETEHALPSGRRIDILSASSRESWLLAIENKVWSAESTNQTSDYYDGLLESRPSSEYQNRLFVYLTPTAGEAGSPHFIPIAYRELSTIVREAVSFGGPTRLGKRLASEYQACLESLMTEDSLRMACWQLYRRHRVAIDSIQRYGKGSPLAYRVQQLLLEDLRVRPIQDGNSVELTWRTFSGGSWIALLRDTWPHKDYPGYYGIWWDPQSLTHRDTIDVHVEFDGPIGKVVRKRFEESLGAVPGPQHFTAEATLDVERQAELAAKHLRALIESTHATLERVLQEVIT